MSILGLGAEISVDGLSAGGSFTIGVGQSFSTQSLANTGLALYTLSIRDPSPPNALIAGYTFPISPANVTEDFTGMSTMYDVAGDPTEFGVHRVIDAYGNSPSSFLIEGTTGWQRHSTDGFAFTGMQSIALLKSILNQYAQLNALRQQQGSPTPYLLEYYDYFSGNYWEVVPIGKQTIRITRQRPLIFDYSFRLVGVRNLAAPIPQPLDLVLAAFATPAAQAQAALQVSLGGVLGNYNIQGTLGL